MLYNRSFCYGQDEEKRRLSHAEKPDLHRYHQGKEGACDGGYEEGAGLCSAECKGHE